MPEEWIVLLEAAASDTSAIGPNEVRRLLEGLDPGLYATGLYAPDRYALQLSAPGSTPGEALADVLSRWRNAVRQLGLPPFDLVRVEVVTPQELERELRSADDT